MLHVLKYHQAIQTVMAAGARRLAAGDDHRRREPRARPGPAVAAGAAQPFNSQRFKGPLAELPKPADVVRVMCYGDSLTDGPPRGGWPTWLHRLLVQQPPAPGRRFEVLNAGVAGYSSHQGVLRFLQEVDRYDPDLSWSRSAGTTRPRPSANRTRSSKIPPWPLVVCQRALIRYRAYLVLMYYTRAWRAGAVSRPRGPVLIRGSASKITWSIWSDFDRRPRHAASRSSFSPAPTRSRRTS